MNSKSILHIEGILARRGRKFCLAVPQLELHSGTILCITGPNGSGKTTLVEHIVGLTPPDMGSVRIHEQLVTNNLYHVRSSVGYIPDDEDWLIAELTAQEYFKVLGNVYRKAGVIRDFQARCDDLARRLSFTSYDVPIAQLSHGNKKKVQIIAGLMHDPEVIVIDELRNGLDPLAIMASEQIIKTAAEHGACIVAATHDLWWAERIADEVLLLIDGQIVMHKTVAATVQAFGGLEQAFIQKMEQHNELILD